MKHVVEYDVYLDILLMVSIYVIKYLFVREHQQIRTSCRLTVMRPGTDHMHDLYKQMKHTRYKHTHTHTRVTCCFGMGILFVYRSPACVYRCIACCFIYIVNVFCIHRLCASLSLSLSIYIHRPLLARGHQAARDSLSITFLLSSMFFNVQSAGDQSAVDQSAVCWPAGQQPGDWYWYTGPSGVPLYPPPGGLPQLGVSQGESRNYKKSNLSPRH